MQEYKNGIEKLKGRLNQWCTRRKLCWVKKQILLQIINSSLTLVKSVVARDPLCTMNYFVDVIDVLVGNDFSCAFSAFTIFGAHFITFRISDFLLNFDKNSVEAYRLMYLICRLFLMDFLFSRKLYFILIIWYYRKFNPFSHKTKYLFYKRYIKLLLSKGFLPSLHKNIYVYSLIVV